VFRHKFAYFEAVKGEATPLCQWS